MAEVSVTCWSEFLGHTIFVIVKVEYDEQG